MPFGGGGLALQSGGFLLHLFQPLLPRRELFVQLGLNALRLLGFAVHPIHVDKTEFAHALCRSGGGEAGGGGQRGRPLLHL